MKDWLVVGPHCLVISAEMVISESSKYSEQGPEGCDISNEG
jgi:hypothetical protein